MDCYLFQFITGGASRNKGKGDIFFPVIPEKLSGIESFSGITGKLSEIESFSGITGKVYLKLFEISASNL